MTFQASGGGLNSLMILNTKLVNDALTIGVASSRDVVVHAQKQRGCGDHCCGPASGVRLSRNRCEELLEKGL